MAFGCGLGLALVMPMELTFLGGTTGPPALQFNIASNSMYIPLISARDQATVTTPSVPIEP